MRKKKGEELYFVILTSSYLAYLSSYESKVSKKTDRPFIGVILKVENREYFAPLSSPKEKHKKMRETMDIIKIKNGKLGVINLNNMIPVLNHYKSMVKVNLSMLKKSDNINDKKYYLLLDKQLKFCNESIKKFLKKLKYYMIHFQKTFQS
ncbi:type III toxin-antitoxin system ToxN/AbiQ family toxin [Leptotrichia massiliensis]